MDLQVVYLSRAAGSLSDDDLRQILTTSRRNNARLGVTGALLYSADQFLQVLEGPMSVVEDLLHRIEADPRHRDLSILTRGPVSQRAFPNWSMGLVTDSDRTRRAPAYSFLSPTAPPSTPDLGALLELFALGAADAFAPKIPVVLG